MMNVLVSVASKHGATDEIGEVIARTLAERGVQAALVDPEEVQAVTGYDAAVLGSAVYAGRWRPEMRQLIEATATDLRRIPVWLFSSGPLGEPPEPSAEAVDTARLAQLTGARQHRVFAGRLDRADLSFGERAIAAAVKAPTGDFRDWESITDWANSIADILAPTLVS